MTRRRVDWSWVVVGVVAGIVLCEIFVLGYIWGELLALERLLGGAQP